MALPASGLISLSAVNTELSKAATAAITLNDANVRALFGVASGPISLANGYGKSSVASIALTIAANIKNYNIWNSKGGSYSAGHTNVTLTINAGVVVGSTSTATYALSTGSGWSGSDTIAIVNNGYIVGKGGAGGKGRDADSTGGGGGTAGYGSGPAINAQYPLTITNASGYIYSGGGGGGGGWGGYSSGGDGGGGGAGNSGGVGGTPGHDYGYATTRGVYGASGTLLHGGVNRPWAPPYAGAGGEPGADGGQGGGYTGGGHALAIQRNGYAITWVSGNTRVYGGLS